MTSRLGKLVLIARSRTRDLVQESLKSVGILLTRTSRWNQLQNQRDRLFEALAKSAPPPRSGTALHGIVFSKDRPMQLDALLNSYFQLVENAAPLTVLYRPTSAAYRTAYHEIAHANRKRPVRLVEEISFKEDLRTALEHADSERLFYLVDDNIFIAGFDMNDLIDADLTQFIPSLRLGMSLDYCYPVAKRQPLPPHTTWKHGLQSWLWREGTLDWAYPMSVDGNIFSRAEIMLMTKISDFKGPNTYEEALHSFSSLFLDRKGLCYASPRLVNIPANRVQTEHGNYAGDTSSDSLLAHWQKGYRIDWAKLMNYPNRSAHQEIDLPLRLAS